MTIISMLALTDFKVVRVARCLVCLVTHAEDLDCRNQFQPEEKADV